MFNTFRKDTPQIIIKQVNDKTKAGVTSNGDQKKRAFRKLKKEIKQN